MIGKWRKKKILLDPGQSAGDKAGKLFRLGDNCTRAVLQATCDDVSDEVLQLARAFGGGIGDSQCLCGAVTGGVMSLALQGRGDLSGRLVEQFREQQKTTCCKGLSAGYTWLSREHLDNCRRITEETAELVRKLLKS